MNYSFLKKITFDAYVFGLYFVLYNYGFPVDNVCKFLASIVFIANAVTQLLSKQALPSLA